MSLISIIVPVYKCSEALPLLYYRTVEAFYASTVDFELLLVYDGGPNEDLDVIRQLCLDDKRVIGIELSRNFGQHRAIFAGLSFAKGDWIVLMDCDVQDRP